MRWGERSVLLERRLGDAKQHAALQRIVDANCENVLDKARFRNDLPDSWLIARAVKLPQLLYRLAKKDL